MRPSKNPANGTFSGGTSRIEALPRNGDTLQVGTAKYFNPRTDAITMTPAGQLIYNYGTAAVKPTEPTNIDPADLLLHKIHLNPFTMNKNDVGVFTYDYQGYKMADIKRIDRRLGNLERLYTLSAAELNLAKMEVYDPNNQSVIRQMEGLTGDNLQDKLQSDWYNDEYRARINKLRSINVLTPKIFQRAVGMTYDSAASGGLCVIKGSTVWPKYSEVVADFSQQKATEIDNVNQFETPQHIASSELIPEGDYFTVRKKVDQSYSSTSNSSLIVKGTNEVVTND